MEEEFETQSRAILVGNDLYIPYEDKREGELEDRVTRLANFVYGLGTIIFDIKKRMASRARRINVTDL